MEKATVAVELPKDLVERIDLVAHREMRSRANTVKVLITEALGAGAREPFVRDEPKVAS
jgi:metal-responsive CopG/Arc/MetJ family transcriptional regulator